MAPGDFAAMIRRYGPTVLVVAALLGLLAVAVHFMIFAWNLTDARMSGHGWAALILGVFFSLAVGIGLMGLIFFSARRGYDEPPRFDQ
jgi:hypothetical protein